ncbi:MAG: hypothetical protein NXI20_10395 [bacterium]|nr:hypothetical protein [bacterium]
MKGVFYFLFLAVVFLGIFITSTIFHKNEDLVTSEAALKPDLLLSNSKYYVQEHAYDRSLHHLDLAIQAMRKIEEQLDDEGVSILEGSIDKLMVIHKEIEDDSLSLSDMDYAFSRALDALTFAELKVSELLLETDHDEQAIVALKYGMLHLKNALRFSSGHKKDYEIHIYDEIDSLLASKSLTHDEIKVRLEHLISELDELIKEED